MNSFFTISSNPIKLVWAFFPPNSYKMAGSGKRNTISICTPYKCNVLSIKDYV